MKRVLIIGVNTKESPYIKEFAQALHEDQTAITIELFDPTSFKKYTFENNRFVLLHETLNTRICNWIQQVRLIRAPLFYLLGFFYFLFSRKRYASTVFHYISPLYAFWVDVLKLKSRAVVCVLWGSDLFEAIPNRHRLYQYLYRRSDQLITGTKDSMDFAISQYPFVKNKIDFVNFGNAKLYKYLTSGKALSKEACKTKWLNAEHAGKIVVSIGYNNRFEHQHIAIFEELYKLNASERNSLFLFLPLTYPKDPDYVKTLSDKLNELGFAYQIIDQYVTAKETMELRNLSDVFINMQLTDMFSASMLEYISTRNIILNGEWLPYSFIEEYDISAYSITLADISEYMRRILTNFESEKEKVQDNAERISRIVNWSILIKKWSLLLKV